MIELSIQIFISLMRWNHLHCRFVRTWPLDHLKGAVRKIIFIREVINNRVNKGDDSLKFLFSSSANRFFCCSSVKRSSSKSKSISSLSFFLPSSPSSYCCLKEEGSFLFQLLAGFSFFLFESSLLFLLFFSFTL